MSKKLSLIELNSCSFIFLKLLLQLDISYDKFIRTTDPKHEAVVKEFYSRVLSNGDIYRADYEGLYCVNCEEYKVRTQLLFFQKKSFAYPSYDMLVLIVYYTGSYNLAIFFSMPQ